MEAYTGRLVVIMHFRGQTCNKEELEGLTNKEEEPNLWLETDKNSGTNN